MRTPLDTVMPLPLVTTPVEFLHVTTGMSEVFPARVPLQISEYTCPATGLPEVLRLMECTDTKRSNECIQLVDRTGTSGYQT